MTKLNRFCISILIFSSLVVKSDIILLDRNTNMSINNRVLIRMANGEFKKNNSNQEVGFGFNTPQGECNFELKNTDIENQYVVRIQQSKVDFVQLYIYYKSGKIDSLPLINKTIGILQRPLKSVDFCYKFSLKKNEKINCKLYSGRKYGSHAPIVSIATLDNFYLKEIYFNHYLAFISGICIIISIAGFFLFLFFHRKMYLVYSIYCICTFFVAVVDAGYGHSYFPFPQILYLNNNLTSIFFYAVVGSHIYLTIVLLKINQKDSTWLYYIGINITLFFIILGILLIFPFVENLFRSLIIKFSYYIVFIMDVYVATSLIYCIKKKQIFVYFYLVGFLFSLIGTTTLILGNIGVIDDINQNYDLGYSIPLIEIFCMLLGVSFQFSDQNKKYISIQKDLSLSQQKVIFIQEEQQKRIAQDLHDGIGQDLLLLKRSLKNQSINTENVEHIIENVRLVSRNLYPVALEKVGLAQAIENITIQVMETHPIFISCDIFYNNSLSKQQELQVFRIFQEATNNALKYAKAKAVKLCLHEETTHLSILIYDNGIGFDVEKKLQSELSFGLQSMLQRSKSMNGYFNIKSNSDGTIITINIPYNDQYTTS